MTAVVLAVDLGGTKVEAALVEPEGRIRHGSRHRAPTGLRTTGVQLEDAVRNVVRAALQAVQPGDVLSGAGIGAAGPVHRAAGTISPLNLAVSEFPITQIVADAVGARVPVQLGLDGQCIAVAEATFGAARDAESSVSMVVSTGVGGGIVLGRQQVYGDRGNAGHIGQMRVTTGWNGEPRSGTLEEIASGPAAVAWARARGWTGSSGEDLARDAEQSSKIAREAIVNSAEAIGNVLAGLSAVLDIELFVIGGGFSYAAADYPELVQATARRLAVLPATHNLVVKRAALGNDAPLVGAACLVGNGNGGRAWERTSKEPMRSAASLKGRDPRNNAESATMHTPEM